MAPPRTCRSCSGDDSGAVAIAPAVFARAVLRCRRSALLAGPGRGPPLHALNEAQRVLRAALACLGRAFGNLRGWLGSAGAELCGDCCCFLGGLCKRQESLHINTGVVR
jgi:hypothetical protein